MDGLLIINKPKDWTSFDVVAKARRILKARKVGHTGTLDPEATGVLLLCIGKATKIVSSLLDLKKEYQATVKLGVKTDTLDTSGAILAEKVVPELTGEEIEAVLQKFRGEIEQVPPLFSAIRKNGVRLYRLARRGVSVALEPRKVTIHELELLHWRPPFLTLRVLCSKGTYLRALARDLGEVWGCGGSLSSLVRRRIGPFSLDNALTIEEVISLPPEELEKNHLLNISQALNLAAAADEGLHQTSREESKQS